MDERLQAILKKVWPEWEPEREIGGGAFGTVWQAVRRDLAGESRAAIKVITVPQGDEDIAAIRAEGYSPEQTRDYFRKVAADYASEIQLLESVKGYTNIVAIDDYKIIHDEEEERWYILIRMELLQKVDYQSMQEAEIVQLGIEICTALSVCREKNIVHRDIKPDNILMNDTRHYKLGDFGVARSLGESTNGMSVKGTPNYMAPEAYKALLRKTDIDAAAKADIYSLGMVMYWIGNGTRLPFMPDKQIPTMKDREEAFSRRIGGEELPPPAKVSGRLQEIILKACAYEPVDRYGSAAEMRAELETLLQMNAPIPTAEPAANTKNRKKLIAAVAALIVMIGLLCALVLPKVLPPRSQEAESGRVVSAEQAPEERMIHITLTAPETLQNHEQYNAVKELLKERLNVFAGGKAYQITEQEGTFELYLPADLFGNETVENVLRCYLTRPVRLYLQDKSSSTDAMEVPRDALAGVEVLTGSIPGVDASEHGIEDTTYRYIKLVLSNEFAEAHQETYSAWKNPIFSQDVEDFPNYYFYHLTFPAGDGKTFYLLNNDNGGRGTFTDLVAFNLQHDSYPESISFNVDLNSMIQWETALEDGTYKGKLQCGANDFEEGTITFTLKYYGDDMTEGKLLDLRNALGTNLDALGQPYAFGMQIDGTNSVFAIKTLPARINDDIVELLGGSFRLLFRTEKYEESVASSKSLRLEQDEKNRLTLYARDDWDYLREDIRKLAQTADQETESVYLFAEHGDADFPILRTGAKHAAGPEKELPVDLTVIRNGRIVPMERTVENEWMIGFLQAVLETRSRLDSLQYFHARMNPDAKGETPKGDSLLPNLYSDAGEINNIIQKIRPEAEMSYQEGELKVQLHLPVDEQFPAKAAELTSKIYEALAGNDYYTNGIMIFLADEETGERARVAFDRRYGWITSSGETHEEEGKYRYTILIGGGKFEAYAAATEEELAKTEWHQTLKSLL